MRILRLLFAFFIFSPLFASEAPKIVVVGAGLSGLTTAYRLQEKGFAVDVLEARNRVGGRVFTANILGHIGELGAQNIRDGGEADHILHLLDELSLETEGSTSILRLNYFNKNRMTDLETLLKQCSFTAE